MDNESADGAAIARRLRELKNQRGLTLAQLARLTDLPKPSIEGYMSRKNPQKPGHDAIIAISKGLGVPTDWLLFDEELGNTEALMMLSIQKVLFESLKRDEIDLQSEEIKVDLYGKVVKFDVQGYAAIIATLAIQNYKSLCSRGMREGENSL